METARAVVQRDKDRGVATDDPVVERLARASPNHSVAGLFTSVSYVLYGCVKGHPYLCDTTLLGFGVLGVIGLM